ncbi:MAG: N-acetylmuramoyl-L-alanine amidase, partial [Pseudomonadota bacterium]|nr:N-acetylmuramoyl-L-alanine amidase [Pseudomonadota bacterium]
MLKIKKITYLIVHCADTPDTEDLRATDIHDMHLGFGWDGAGYHHIICRDGQIEPGRPFYWQGAHVYGQNENSLGICLIGRQKFTPAQMNSLSRLLHHLKCQYPNAEIVGHRDVQDTAKTCPNFDVRSWWTDENLLNGQTAVVTASVTELYQTPPKNMHTGTVLDTELLLGEAVVLSGQTTNNGFVHITALHDGYQGWVKLSDLAKPPETLTANAKICQPFAVLTAGPDIKSACLQQLP